MTFWIYNPPEPSGQPTAPGPDASFWDTHSGPDLFTRGRCGGCGACPKMWRMEVPILEGNPYKSDYAGVVYLQRMPYRYLSSAGIEFGDAFSDQCAWAQSLAPHFPDANTYLGPFSGPPVSPVTVGEIGTGWHLTFESSNDRGTGWSLYSPIDSGTIEFNPDAQSRWIFEPGFAWRCLGPNTFRVPSPVGAHRFPYEPEALTLTPIYG